MNGKCLQELEVEKGTYAECQLPKWHDGAHDHTESGKVTPKIMGRLDENIGVAVQRLGESGKEEPQAIYSKDNQGGFHPAVLETPAPDSWEESFDLLWGIAPPDSLKGKKGADIKSFIHSLLERERSKAQSFVGDIRKVVQEEYTRMRSTKTGFRIEKVLEKCDHVKSLLK